MERSAASAQAEKLLRCRAQRAIKAGVTSSLQVYASAIGACKCLRSADLDAALQVYSDMQRCASPHSSCTPCPAQKVTAVMQAVNDHNCCFIAALKPWCADALIAVAKLGSACV